ncbi:MAG: menaquinone biosynthesis decarboxylase [Bacteroidia bacterium]|nr:menaquinone biosynthesis decarboxylase [Bacteroidia bacterium]
MPFKNLQDFISCLEKNGELIRIKDFVDPVLEITEVTDRFSKQPDGGKALLFENTGTDFPVLINAFGSNKRMCLALGVNDLDDTGKEIESFFKEITGTKTKLLDKLKMLPLLSRISSWMPKTKKGRGECQEIIYMEPDIAILPVLKCWPYDGGRFITLPMVNTKDPVSGIRNVGMYRMQVFEKNVTGMHWHLHKTGARHYTEYKKLGIKMPVAVALGGDPVYTYAATAPLPDNMDEYMLAGFLRKQKVELVKCITQDIEVPADADFVIEGFVDPDEDLIWEGPFGDHTGFYSLADWYPKFHITCITHRKNAVYPATIVGIPPMEDSWIGKATERIFLTPIRIAMLPEVIDIDMPVAGVAHNILIVKIENRYPGHALKVMNALWGAGQMMFNKIMVVTDNFADIHNYFDVAKAVSENVDPATDIHFSKGPLDILDHSSEKPAFGGKIFFDATQKTSQTLNHAGYKNDFEKINFTQVIKQFPEIKEINDTLLYKGISVLIAAVKKIKTSAVFCLAEELFKIEIFSQVKFFIITDEEADISDLFYIAWIVSANIDTVRDCRIIKSSVNTAHLIIDGTRKNREFDGFERDWPNVVISNNDTIKKVDEIWDKLGYPKIGSPSSKYKTMASGNSAIFH